MKKAQYIAMWTALLGVVATQSARADFSVAGLLSGKETASVVQKARATSIPALRCIPKETDGVAAAGKEYASMMAVAAARELHLDLSADDVARSVSSAAVSLGKGGEQACRAALAVQNCLQELAVTNHLKQYVAHHGSGALQSAAVASLQETCEAQVRKLKEQLNSLNAAPLYAVFTAAKGQEETFRQFGEQVCRSLAALAPEGGEAVQVKENSVLSISLDRLAGGLAEDLGLSADDRRELLAELAKHKLCVMTRQESAALRIMLAFDREDVAWPSGDDGSLLVAPELNGMDEHAETAKLTVWCSAALQACAWESNSTFSVLESMKKLFSDLAGSAPADARAFEAASRGVETLRAVTRQFPQPRRPMTLQIWGRSTEERPNGQGEDLGVDFRTDACGASFVQGKIMRQFLAAGSAVYLETTGFVNPNQPDCSGVPDALLDIISGVYLTLNEELKDRASMGMMLVQQFRPQILGVWENLAKINRSLSYPMTLVITRSGEKKVGGGLRLTVTDHDAVIAGWNDLIRHLKSIAGAMAMPPSLLDHLPVYTQPLPDGAMRCTLAFPVANGAYQPQMILGESKMTLAGDSVLADALSKDDGDGRPFCGACFELNMDELLLLAGKSENESCKPSGRIRGEAVVQDGMLRVTMDAVRK